MVPFFALVGGLCIIALRLLLLGFLFCNQFEDRLVRATCLKSFVKLRAVAKQVLRKLVYVLLLANLLVPV